MYRGEVWGRSGTLTVHKTEAGPVSEARASNTSLHLHMLVVKFPFLTSMNEKSCVLWQTSNQSANKISNLKQATMHSTGFYMLVKKSLQSDYVACSS